MRAIERTTQFKRDFKREMKGRHRATLEAALTDVIHVLANDAPLADRYRDHSLSGSWSADPRPAWDLTAERADRRNTEEKFCLKRRTSCLKKRSKKLFH